MQYLAKKRPNRTKENQGLTVLELLITLAAIAVVVLVAVPGSDMLLEKHRLKGATNSLLSGLELARSEAYMRSSTVVMCPSSNGHSCRRDGNWEHGWLVFSDGNANGTVQDIELIQSFEAPSQKVKIKADGAIQARATFTMTGLVGEDGIQTGQFVVCAQNSDTAASILKVDPDGWIQKVPPHGESCGPI